MKNRDMTKQDHRPADESRTLILSAFTTTHGALTRTQICHAIDRQKTPHLIEMIESLVDDGYLMRRVKVFGNGVEGYVYELINGD